MPTKSKTLRKLEKAMKTGEKELQPQLRARLRNMERMVRELRKQIRQLYKIRTLVNRNHRFLGDDLKVARELVGRIQEIDKEWAEADKSKDKERAKEMWRRMRRRDVDANTRLGDLKRRTTRAELIETKWDEIRKALAKLAEAE
ncbi:MAG: hypothetical protein ACFBRM_02920 [Pikeienuella sp.]